MTSVRGWSPQETNDRYDAYVQGKLAAGLNPREQDGWAEAVERFGHQKDRGDEFRDLAWDELGAAEPEWAKETHRATALGARFHDIGRQGRGRQEGFEFKAGGGDGKETLRQLAKDERLVQAGGRVTWVGLDLGKQDARVRDRLAQMSETYPGRFESVDLANPQSVADYAARHPERAQAFAQAGEQFRANEQARAPQAAAAPQALPQSQAPTQSTAAGAGLPTPPAPRQTSTVPGAAQASYPVSAASVTQPPARPVTTPPVAVGREARTPGRATSPPAVAKG